MTYTADQIVTKYIEIRDFAKEIRAKHALELKPYNDAMETLEGLAGEMMRETGQKALSTEHGTAFFSRTLSVTCEDPTSFLDFVFKHQARQFLTAHVAKEAVQVYMDGPGEGHPPPGVKVVPVVNVNFRKA